MDVELDTNRIIEEVSSSLRETAEDVIPWFMTNMPPVYFQDTNHAAELSHLKAIIAAKASGRPLVLTHRSEDGSQWTLMRPLDYPGVLAEMVRELPRDRPLQAAKIHTAINGQLVLDTFEFGDDKPFHLDDSVPADKLQETIDYATTQGIDWSKDEIGDYFSRCRSDYVTHVTPIRMARHWKLYQEVSGTDGTAVSLEPETDPQVCRIVAAVSNATTRMMFERIATRLSESSIHIHRAHLDTINDGDYGYVVLIGFVCSAPGGGVLEEDSPLWESVRRDLLRMKWLDKRTLAFSQRHPEVELLHAEILTGLCDLSHQVLVKKNPYAYTQDRIHRLMEKNVKPALRIVELFLARFDPDQPLSDDEFHARTESLGLSITNAVDLEDSRTVLNTMLDAVEATLRTNVYLEKRYGLAFRLDPIFLATEERSELPFGVFFVHGRSFNGFHVRFRDIARGGVRAIRPLGGDQFAHETERLYDEAYQLAYAQQLKNKDIPEGGSKAAILLEPQAKTARSVKGFVDCLLDLITPDPDTRHHIVDYFHQNELLYLGPDENITPELITWIVNRARRRGYPTPTALMSSKPGAGINHKEYGVTSEGVNVFLMAALKAVGINPHTQSFTVKITGGPDGDVGGNMMRILHRDYGDRAKILGIADGSGSGEDPDGLNHDELLRLVQGSLPIAEFDRSKLGPNGRVTALRDPDGVHLRNTLHNRLLADAFVPCGGRPATIHGGNWRDYLCEDGTPSSKVIVEGANLFLTPDARIHLSDLGLLIMKDSSANKCGVICSSFEIAACMMLEEKEFLAIKEQFVEQVLEILRNLARREAELLGRLHCHRPHVPLPETSTRLSRVMMRTADAIERAIEGLSMDERKMLDQLVVEYLPRILVETAGERLWKRTPQAYLKWIMAKSLAARIVYREGFEYLETMSQPAIAELAVRYLGMELERRHLIDRVADSDLADRERISELLERAGILSTLGDDA